MVFVMFPKDAEQDSRRRESAIQSSCAHRAILWLTIGFKDFSRGDQDAIMRSIKGNINTQADQKD